MKRWNWQYPRHRRSLAQWRVLCCVAITQKWQNVTRALFSSEADTKCKSWWDAVWNTSSCQCHSSQKYKFSIHAHCPVCSLL